MTIINAQSARHQLADLMNRCAYRGECFTLARRGRKMALMVPVEPENGGARSQAVSCAAGVLPNPGSATA
jgi:antitoxin (DNA-binding transcriptional repressor) of toxin-antitoxin stability system